VIRHLVLFKLNDGVSRDDPQVAAAAETWSDLGGKIPEVQYWETGWNVSDRPIAYDFAINSAVADREALQRYLAHPAHQEGVAEWRQFSTWIIADYEF
jgi:hypothetical protein